MDTKQLSRNEQTHLIQSWKFYLVYSADGIVPLSFIYYANDVGMDNRDKIHQAGLDNNPQVIEIDKKVVELAATKIRATYKKEEQQNKPIESWWWYLDKIHDRTYPTELLPPHLQQIYLK